MTTGLALVCKHCRWRPPSDLEMALVEAHFDVEPDHDPTDIKLDLVMICDRCDVEMPFERAVPRPTGGEKHYFGCPQCRRTKTAIQHPPAATDPEGPTT